MVKKEKQEEESGQNSLFPNEPKKRKEKQMSGYASNSISPRQDFGET